MSKQKISLVTGAGGFIASNLIRSLIFRGDKIEALVRPDSQNWRLEDISDQINIHKVNIFERNSIVSLVENIKPDYVFHLAQYGGNRNQLDHSQIRKVIIDGTIALYEACEKTKSCKAIIYAGSSSEYGFKKEAMSEKMILKPNSEYGLAKAWATLYGQYMAEEKKMPIVALRFFSVFGPYEDKNRLIPSVIMSCLNKKPIQLSNKDNVRDFVYVNDAVNAIIKASDNPKPGEIFNIGTGKQTTFQEIVNIITRLTGENIPQEWGKFSKPTLSITNWKADMNHTNSVLEWENIHSLEGGLKKTIEWFKKNKNLYENH